ncbi:MAG: hypothetical protein Q8L48_07720 [Archangium sp.]|nr:hypothetical protein [Archangium sp.]
MTLALAIGLALTAAAEAAPGAEHIDDVRPLFDLVTCQGAPPGLDAATAEGWCVRQRRRYQSFSTRWGPRAQAFLTPLKPANLPTTLVYPFGGGDLMSALQVFPEATELTTISLELAGDPRRWRRLTDPASLKKSLKVISEASESTLINNDSVSEKMSVAQRGELPGQLSMHLIGLALAGQEPVSVRFFRLEADGTLHYLSAEDIDALEGTKATKLNAEWKSPDFSPAFANVEVQFVPKGQPAAPRRVHRHIAANLANKKLPPGLIAHLEAKGRVSAMTKAASYLLWGAGFKKLRDYLTSNAAFMVSDSTGVPPSLWKEKGCTVEAYGKFEKPFLVEADEDPALDEVKALFAHAKKVPMRFGYADGTQKKNDHLMIAKCPAKP